MLKTNLKIAIRNLWKAKGYTLINICGLALGLASCILLLLYVSYQWHFDHSFSDLDRIHIVEINWHAKDNRISTSATTPSPLAPALAQSLSDVEAVARLNGPFKQVISYKRHNYIKRGGYVDPSFLEVFQYPFLMGSRQSALTTPNGIVLTERLATRLFGQENPMYKKIKVDNQTVLQVTGVIADPPINTSIQFDYLLPWALFKQQHPDDAENWYDFSYQTYLKLASGANVGDVNKMITTVFNQHFNGLQITPFVYPMRRWHLYSEFKNGKPVGGKITQVRLFAILALGILLIACINFTNLLTARSEKRIKEVGIRKAIGATRRTLILQFIGESFLLTSCSIAIALLLVKIYLPTFNHILDLHLSFDYRNPFFWTAILALIILTGIIAGSYPAFYLSSFSPQTALKKGIHTGKSLLKTRQLLVIIQFSFVVGLIIATLVIYRQINYIRKRPIGYNKNNLIEMSADGFLSKNGGLRPNFTLFKTKLIQSGAITAICPTSLGITDNESSTWGLSWQGMQPGADQIVFDQIATTYGFSKTFKIKLLKGRDFSSSFGNDSSAVMLNETAIRTMHLQDPIGKLMKWQGKDRKITGIFKDFVWGSPFKPVAPMVVAFQPNWIRTITMRLNPKNNISASLHRIKAIYNRFIPDYPFHFHFVDDAFGTKFKTEQRLGTLINLFGGLAIFISCIGLLALVAYTTQQRKKEISIRRVLGASVRSIVVLISATFIKWILIANILGCLLGGWIMHKWLQNYSYSMDLNWHIFLYAILISTVLALLTVGWYAWRSAKVRPAESLKYE